MTISPTCTKGSWTRRTRRQQLVGTALFSWCCRTRRGNRTRNDRPRKQIRAGRLRSQASRRHHRRARAAVGYSRRVRGIAGQSSNPADCARRNRCRSGRRRPVPVAVPLQLDQQRPAAGTAYRRRLLRWYRNDVRCLFASLQRTSDTDSLLLPAAHVSGALIRLVEESNGVECAKRLLFFRRTRRHVETRRSAEDGYRVRCQRRRDRTALERYTQGQQLPSEPTEDTQS